MRGISPSSGPDRSLRTCSSSQRTAGPRPESSFPSSGSHGTTRPRRWRSSPRTTSCRSRRRSWPTLPGSPPGSTGTPTDSCCSAPPRPGPRSSTGGSSLRSRWARRTILGSGGCTGSGRNRPGRGRASVWKPAASGTRSCWSAGPRAEPFLGTDEEAWALHQAYALIPTTSFARAILEPCPPSLAVAALPRLTWSDLGSPGRVYEILAGVRRPPAWALASDLTAS